MHWEQCLLFMVYSESIELFLKSKNREMKNSFKIALVFVISIMMTNCKKEEKSPSYNKGDLTIFTDESFQSVTEALADGYMINYPETRIKVETKKKI